MINKTGMLLLVAAAAISEAGAAQPLRCVIEPDRVAELGTPVIGVVESVHVERGDYVKQGQLLAQLRANVERASVNAAETRAQAEADVQAALVNHEFQRQKLARTEELMQKKFVSAQALDQVRAEASVAEQRLAQAREQKRIAQQELQTAHAQLGLRQIRAPFSGVVADRYVNVGERVEVKPMFRVARMDPLRVEVIAPASLYGMIRKGMSAQITPDLPSAAQVAAKVVLVDQMIDPASNTFRVRAELPNGNGALPSGLRCKAELAGVTDTAPAAPAAASRGAEKSAPGRSTAARGESVQAPNKGT